ncbi:alpha-L-rhamnosidase [Xylariomycetidae sp. FL0641]|nr:alpha-L-rhamnosidase [Xylariomycetidae sp. FL0641]
MQLTRVAGFASLASALSVGKPRGVVSKDSSSTQANDVVHSVSGGTVSLSADGSGPAIVVLDYGYDVEGLPTFEVVDAKGDTSMLEITYGEPRAAVDLYMSDGPLPMAAAMDSYRVNHYNITGPEVFTNRLIQGGFRYQKFNLSSTGSVELRNVGVKPTTDTTPLTDLPGSFSCSDEDFTRIWHVGARTVQLSEFPKNTIPNYWTVSSEGTAVDSQIPQILGIIEAQQLTQYDLNFEVKPVTGGFGFIVLSSTLNVGIYIHCDITSGTISAHYGSTERDSAPLASAKLPTNITLGSWHSVHATAALTDVSVFIDGTELLSFTQTSAFYGSCGFGAAYRQSAIFRNFELLLPSGDEVYSSTLTDESFLVDFMAGTNPLDSIVDGSKRDRIAYTGDLDIALGSSFASTHGLSFAEDSIKLLGSFQTAPGFFIPNAKIQQYPLKETLDINITGLIGYSFNLLTGIAQYYDQTGDAAFAQTWAEPVVNMLDWADSQVLDNGLLNISDASFAGDWNYYDPTQPGVVCKFNTVYAYALQQCIPFLQGAGTDTATYEARLDALRTAIDTQLWSDDLQAYVLSEAVTDGFAQDANALAILAGVTSGNHSAATILSSMASTLYQPAGPLAFSPSTTARGFARYISPYASAYHLRAAFEAGDAAAAAALLRSLWAPMADPAGQNYTGCFWETLDADGRPALGIMTSLCHGWAAGPTAELSRHVLGARAAAPGFASWRVRPLTLGLAWAHGTVPTPKGGIAVDWRFDADGLLSMVVDAPRGTNGTIHLPTPLRTSLDDSVVRVNGKVVAGTSFAVQGGETFMLVQEAGGAAAKAAST